MLKQGANQIIYNFFLLSNIMTATRRTDKNPIFKSLLTFAIMLGSFGASGKSKSGLTRSFVFRLRGT